MHVEKTKRCLGRDKWVRTLHGEVRGAYFNRFLSSSQRRRRSGSTVKRGNDWREHSINFSTLHLLRTIPCKNTGFRAILGIRTSCKSVEYQQRHQMVPDKDLKRTRTAELESTEGEYRMSCRAQCIYGLER